MGMLYFSVMLVIITTILWKVSSVARCYIKYIIFGVASCIFACAPIPLMLLKPRDSVNALIPAFLIRNFCRLLGVRSSLEGHDHIVKDSGCVVLINHQSMLDLLVLAQLWPMGRCTQIAKKQIMYFGPFALASWLWGTIFIDRMKGKDAQMALNKTGQTIRTRKARLLMFPEGTRNNSEKLLPFKKGAFHVALAAHCPIQPVVVNRYRFIGDHRFDKGEIRVRILPAISTEGFTAENLDQLVDKVHKVMSEGVDVITRDVDGKKTE